MYIDSKIGIMISIVTQTPSRHLRRAFFRLMTSVSMLKIHVLKQLSSIMKKMHNEVVIGERARVSAKLRFLYI